MQDASMDQESEDENGDDQFIDVLDVLDGRGEPHTESDTGIKQSEDISEEGAEGDEEMDEEDPLVPSEDEDDAPAALDQLEGFISKLDTASHKRKLPETESVPDRPPHKRRTLKESTVTGPENEFNAHSSCTYDYTVLKPTDIHSEQVELGRPLTTGRFGFEKIHRLLGLIF